MYIVLKDGHKLPVDDSLLDYENDFVPCCQNVGMYSEEVYLKPVWFMQLQKDNSFGKTGLKGKTDLEFVAEYKYDHEPSVEEMLYRLSENGLGIGDIVTVEKGFELDVEYDD